jgi:hypothetical protein
MVRLLNHKIGKYLNPDDNIDDNCFVAVTGRSAWKNSGLQSTT